MSKRIYYNSRNSGPFDSIIGLVVMIGFFYLLFKLSSFVFQLLWYAAPLMLIATLIMDHKIVTNYVNWVFQKLKTNPLFGIAMILLTVFGFPVVSGYLFAKLMFKRKVKKMTEQFSGQEQPGDDFTDFEEVDSAPLELPELPPKMKDKADNKYDDMFE